MWQIICNCIARVWMWHACFRRISNDCRKRYYHILTFNEIDLSSVVTKFNIFIKVFLFFLTTLPEQVTWILIEYNLLLWQKVMKLNSWLFTIVAKTLAAFDLKRMKWLWKSPFMDWIQYKALVRVGESGWKVNHCILSIYYI